MKIKIYIIYIFLLAFITAPGIINGEDYQYQYFNKDKDKYVPFSDYIPKVRLHYETVPHYLEDYYLLYGLKQYYNENTLRKNIDRLNKALGSKFRHPSEALVKIETEEEYLKYRRLMFMHINLLIMRSHMRIASRYDKQKIYFFNNAFAKEINESLGIAEQFYKDAIPYWKQARDYAEKASSIKITTDLSYIESERYSIINGDLDFGKIIDTHIQKIGQKKEKLNNAPAAKSR